MLNMITSAELDAVVVKTVSEMEKAHNCWIFILSDGADFFMNVVENHVSYSGAPVRLCSVSCNKFEVSTAIRRYCRGLED